MKVDEAGDSQFYKDCAGVIWNDVDLCERSAAGGICPTQPDKGPSKPCSPKKKQYLASE